MTHRYQVGQRLKLSPTPMARAGGHCKVLTALPFEGRALQYRVQVEGEQTQRVVAEADLSASTTVEVEMAAISVPDMGIAIRSKRARS